MCMMISKTKAQEKGQTSVEYIFMIAVVALLAFTILGQFRSWMVANGAEDCEVNSAAFVCRLSSFLPRRGYHNFKTYSIR